MPCHVKQLLYHVGKPTDSTGAIQELLKWLPVLLIDEHSSQSQVLVNLHELVMNRQSMSNLLNLEKEIEDQAAGDHQQENDQGRRGTAAETTTTTWYAAMLWASQG